MTENPRVLPLCEMRLGGRILGFKVEEDHMAYCWNCLRLPPDIEEIRKHLNGGFLDSDDLYDPSFYSGLQVKPRPYVPNESDNQ